MQWRYSDQLRERCKRVMSKRAGFDITDERAEMILDRLARIGELAVKVLKIEDEKKHHKTKKVCDQ